MPFNTPFKRLTAKDAGLLLNQNYQIERRTYLDCLAILHDLISPYEYESGIPVFAMFKRSIDRQLIDSTAAPLQKTLAIVSENVQANADTAFDLVSRSSLLTAPTLLQLATAYNNRLLTQYSLLR